MSTKHLTTGRPGKENHAFSPIPAVAEQVGREILESRMEPGAWATALHECGGRRQEAIAHYTRLRIRVLTRQHRHRLAKMRSLEQRRVAQCMSHRATREAIAKTIEEMLHSPLRGKSRNFFKPRVSLVWLTILFIGASGTAAAFARLYSISLPGLIASTPLWLAALVGSLAVAAALGLRFLLPKHWIMLGWNTGIVVSCNLLCLGSLLLGTKIIKRAVASDAVAITPALVSSGAAAKSPEPPPAGQPKPRLVSHQHAPQHSRPPQP